MSSESNNPEAWTVELHHHLKSSMPGIAAILGVRFEYEPAIQTAIANLQTTEEKARMATLIVKYIATKTGWEEATSLDAAKRLFPALFPETENP